MDELYSQELEQRVFKALSDSEWQIYFQILKKVIASSSHMRHSSYYNKESDDIRKHDYCTFIDSVLYSLRGGKTDYCYHIYQIVDLLYFEKDRLKTRWLPEHKCFKVYF